jgi:hypothetical protein
MLPRSKRLRLWRHCIVGEGGGHRPREFAMLSSAAGSPCEGVLQAGNSMMRSSTVNV